MKKIQLLISRLTLSLLNINSNKKISYCRNKIINKYSENYSILLDNEKIEFSTIYLDRDNIRNVIINKKNKTLNISQIEKRELFEIKKINLDSYSNNRCVLDSIIIDQILLNGIPLTDSLIKKIKIDPNAIRSFEIIFKNRLNTKLYGKRYNGDLVIIITK